MAVQETEIRVRIDDNEALSSLREMLDLVERIQQGAGGIALPPGAGPAPAPAPAPTPTPDPSAPGPDGEGAGAGAEGAPSRRARAQRSAIERGLSSIIAGTSPGGLLSQLGGTAGELLGGLGSSIPLLSSISRALGGSVSLAAQALGRSLDLRQQSAAEIMGLELQEAELGALSDAPGRTAGDDAFSALRALGFSDQEARGFEISQRQAIGRRGRLDLDQLLRLGTLQRGGVGAGGVSALAGSALEAGGPNATLREAMVSALNASDLAIKGLDLRGAGVDRFLGQFGGIVEGLTQQGLRFDVDQLTGALRGFAGATGARGTRPIGIARGFMAAPQGARGQIAGAFGGLAQTALLADVFARADDPLQAIELLEQMSADPEQVRRKIVGQLGPEAGRLAIAGLPGISGREARALGRRGRLTPLAMREPEQMGLEQIRGALPITTQATELRAETLMQARGVEGDQTAIRLTTSLIEFGERIEQGILSLTSQAELTTGILETVNGLLRRIAP